MTELTEAGEIAFIRQIEKELSFRSTRDVMKRITPVVETLWSVLSLSLARTLASRLPAYFQRSFIDYCEGSVRKEKVNYLDEFVNLLPRHEKETGEVIFKSEEEALNVSILVLKKILKHSSEMEWTESDPYFLRQLRDIPTEAIAA